MNLFLLAWNFPDEKKTEAITKLREMKEVYPQLDADTIWSFSLKDKVFATSMHTSNKVCHPRAYVKQSKNEVVFYDGCLVNPEGRFQANDAGQLSSQWNELPEALEGQFVIVRISNNPAKIEVLSDYLGIYQIYYLQQNNTWLISNNVRLLRHVSNKNNFDPMGISSHLALNNLVGNHTLIDGINVIPGAQRWKWQENDTVPVCKTYLNHLNLFRRHKKKINKSRVNRLSNELLQVCQEMSKSYGTIECPITGGRDSRVMAALLIHQGIDASYFSTGNPETGDVKIGLKIAECFNLPHVIIPRDYNDIIDNWDNASRQLMMQTDGMTRLMHIGVAINQPNSIEHLPVHFYGLGGEMARGKKLFPKFFLSKHTVEYLQQHLVRSWVSNASGLLTQETLELARTFLRDFVIQAVEEGIPKTDVPLCYYVFERTRRWGGTNFRQVSHYLNVFSPFCTRPFVETTFSIPGILGCSEHVHYHLLQFLAPVLHRMPFEAQKGESWPPQIPAMIYYNAFKNSIKRRVANKFKSVAPKKANDKKSGKSKPAPPIALNGSQNWVKAKRSSIRKICLDQSKSPLWHFVDRSRFEYLTQDDGHLLQNSTICAELANTVALFQYSLFGI